MTRVTWTCTALLATLGIGCLPCDVGQVAKDNAGSGATDCGTFGLGSGSLGTELHDGGFVPADGGATPGVECALQAQDAGHAFRVEFISQGVDTQAKFVFVRTGEGKSLQLTQRAGSSPIPNQSSVVQHTCAGFDAPNNPSNQGLICRNPGAGSGTCF